MAPRPPYSPDIASLDFSLFPTIKTTLKGRRSPTIEEIKENEIRQLGAITESAFQEAFQQWKKRWERFIAYSGLIINNGSQKHNYICKYKKQLTSSVYDCTVEDVEYIYNKLSIHIFNSKRRLSVL